MTFLQVVNIIRDTALAQPNVNTVVREFLDLNREDTKYSAVVIQDRDGLRDRIVEQDWNTYTFHLGYVDRLTFDESNRDDIFSTGINVINNIVSSIRDRWDLEVSIIDRFSTFNQRFTASCAGVYVVLAIQVPISDCVDGEETDLYDSFDVKITENGHYHFVPDGRPVDEIDITVDVPGPKEEELLQETITSNGSYSYSPTPGSVFSDVSISVDVPEKTLRRFHTFFDVSPTTGIFEADPRDLGVDGFSYVDLEMGVVSVGISKTITSNGSYNYSVGDSEVGDAYISDVQITVAVPERKPEESLVETITSNGSYGYSPQAGYVYDGVSLSVDVHPSVSLVQTITSNGSYSYPGEWNGAEITVAVSAAKPEESLIQTISSNGSYSFSPTPGSVFSDASIAVDVHPSLSLSETYYSNGTYTISNENAGGTITVLVPDGELPVPADDEIYYLTYTGEPIVLYNSSDFGANLVSNTYQNGYGILKFDGPISRTGSSSFYNRIGLKKVVLPYSVTEISYSSFANTGLQVVVMQNTVVSIGDVAFSGCFAMTTPFRISTGCELLSDGSFKDCTALTTITIPGRCTRLEAGVFKGCIHLFNIYCNAVVPPVMELNTGTGTYDQFEGCRQDFVIRVPAGSVQAYQAATGWSDYASRIVSQ